MARSVVHQAAEALPDGERALGRADQERGVAVVRRVVALDEVADVDLVLPASGRERLRRGSGHEPDDMGGTA